MTYHVLLLLLLLGAGCDASSVTIIGFRTSPALMTHSPPQAGCLDTGAMVSVVGQMTQIATAHAPHPHPRRKQLTGDSMTVSATAAD